MAKQRDSENETRSATSGAEPAPERLAPEVTAPEPVEPDMDASAAAARAAYVERMNAHAALKHFGVRIAIPDARRVTLAVDHVPLALRGGMRDDAVVNGGVLSALCDLAIGSTSALVDPTARAATVQLSIRFERPLVGERIRGEARVDHCTGRTVFSSAEILDGEGRVCVRCQGMVSLLRER